MGRVVYGVWRGGIRGGEGWCKGWGGSNETGATKTIDEPFLTLARTEFVVFVARGKSTSRTVSPLSAKQ